jgi:predicted anti-sigma-YlaC factor YlaD
MPEETLSHVFTGGPDLLSPPHVLSALMEMFAGDQEQAFAQQEQVLAHLTACQFCRTAVVVLLTVAQEYDRRTNAPGAPTRELLLRFVGSDQEIAAQEAHQFERLGAYAEAIVTEGQDQAAQRFPDLAAHLQSCPDCRSAVDATIAFLSGPSD